MQPFVDASANVQFQSHASVPQRQVEQRGEVWRDDERKQANFSVLVAARNLVGSKHFGLLAGSYGMAPMGEAEKGRALGVGEYRAMSDFDKLLERAADESAIALRNKHSYVDDGTCQCGEEIGSETSFRAHLSGVFLAISKRRLVGLLEAGQAMRDWSNSVTSYEDNVPYVNGKYDSNIRRVQDAYDKLLEGICQ